MTLLRRIWAAIKAAAAPAVIVLGAVAGLLLFRRRAAPPPPVDYSHQDEMVDDLLDNAAEHVQAQAEAVAEHNEIIEHRRREREAEIHAPSRDAESAADRWSGL